MKSSTKKFFSLILALLMLVTVLPIPALADPGARRIVIGTENRLEHGTLYLYAGTLGSQGPEMAQSFSHLSEAAEFCEASKGERVYMRLEPDAGYRMDLWNLLYVVNGTAHDDLMTVVGVGDGWYWFKLPSDTDVPEDYLVELDPSFEKVDYTVSADGGIANGTVAASTAVAQIGDTVTLTAVPADGYRLNNWIVTDAGGNPVAVMNDSFTMPASNVTVSAEFAPVYPVNVVSNKADQVTVENPDAAEGDTVRFLINENRYAADMNNLTVKDSGGTDIEFSWDYEDSFFSFIMPATAVTISVDFYNVQVYNTSHGAVTADKTIAETGETVTLTVAPETCYALSSLSVKDYSTGDTVITIPVAANQTTYTFAMPEISPVFVSAVFSYVVPDEVSVGYIDENGEAKTASAIPLTGSEPWTYNYGADIHLGAAGEETWYVVQGSVVYDKSSYTGFTPNLIADGTVNLILCDGASLSGVGDFAGGAFKVFGQANGTGAATVDKVRGADLYLYGGRISANSVESAGTLTVGSTFVSTGLISCGPLTVAGGAVTAPAVTCDDLTIDGGSLTLTGSNSELRCFGSFTMSGGSFTAAGDVTMNEDLIVTGGVFSVAGTVFSYNGTFSFGWTALTDVVTIGGLGIGNEVYLTGIFNDGTSAHLPGLLQNVTWPLTLTPMQKHNVVRITGAHGTADAAALALAGETVELYVFPEYGYEWATLTVTSGGTTLDLTPITGSSGIVLENSFSFVMPDGDVTVNVTFTLKEGFHAVTVDPATRGTIEVSASAAVAETRIYVSSPVSIYVADWNKLSITDGNGETILMQMDDSWREYFVMPDSDVTITAPVYNICVNQPGGGTLTVDKTIADPGEPVTVTVTPAAGRVLTELYYEFYGEEGPVRADISLTEGVYTYTFTMPSLENAYPPVSIYATLDYVPQTATVSYVDENGDTQTVTATLLLGVEPWTYNYGADIHLGAAGEETWYAVQGSVVYDRSNYQQFTPNLIADGTVNLILCDGASLSGVGNLAGGAFKVYGQTNGTGTATVNILKDTNLTLCGGSVTAGRIENLGSVTVCGGSLSGGAVNCNDLTVTGGTVNVSGILAGNVSISGGTVTSVDTGDDGIGILCFDALTISGGTVTATGGEYGARVNNGASITGGTVTITGGDKAIYCMESLWGDDNPDNNVSITGGSVVINGDIFVYSTLTLGWTNAADSITINGDVCYSTNASDTGVVFANTLFDGTHQLKSKITGVNFDALKYKTLVPYIPTLKVTIDYTYSSHGFASAQEKAMAGEEVPLTMEPAIGCGLQSLTVTAGGDPISCLPSGIKDVYLFTMPDSDVTVTPVFSYMINVEENADMGTVLVLVNDEETLYADPLDHVTLIVTPAPGVMITQFQLTRFTTTGNGQPIAYSFEGTYGGAYTYTFTMPYDAAKVRVSYEPERYTLDTSVSGNGTAAITTEPTGADNTYHYGDRIYLTVTPDAGYVISTARYSYNDDGTQHNSQLQPTDDPTVLYFDMPASPVTVYVSFAKASSIALEAIGPGALTCDHAENVAEGTWVIVTATPNYPDSGKNIKYLVKTISVTGESGAAVTISSTQELQNNVMRYYFYMPAEDVTVHVEFIFSGSAFVDSQAVNGSLIFTGYNTTRLWDVREGRIVPVTVTPAPGYRVKSVYYKNTDDASAGAVAITEKDENGNYVFAMPGYRAKVYAEFEEKSYAVTIADGIENGTVTADMPRADEGDAVTLTVIPDEGYVLESLEATQDGTQVDVDENNCFIMPAGGVTVTAVFKARAKEDVNNDGFVTIADVTALLDYLSAAAGYDEYYDLNGDNAVTISDVTYLLDYLSSVH